MLSADGPSGGPALHLESSCADEPFVEFVKIDPEAPAGFYEYEAAGLEWLAVDDGVPVAPVLDVTPGKITVPKYEVVDPSRDAAFEFGANLAHTHAAGAGWFGAPPAGWESHGYVGHLPLPMAQADPLVSFAEYFVSMRLEPYVRQATDEELLSPDDTTHMRRFMDNLVDAEIFDGHHSVSRIHGDLWSGNIVWTPAGAVLIDPAAHGGHREADLAMLQLFGFRFFDQVLGGYMAVSPLDENWETRFLVHQLHPLLVHTVFFGASYSEHVMSVVRRFV